MSFKENNAGKISEKSGAHVIEECEVLKPSDKLGDC